MGLAMDDQRIDAAPDIVHRRIAGDRHGPGRRVHLDLADGAAVGEDLLVHLVVGHHGQPARKIVRQVAIRRRAGELQEIQRPVAVGRAETAAGKFHPVHRCREHNGGDPAALFDQFRRRHGHHRGGVTHGTARVRPPADADQVGVAHDDADHRDRHVEQVRDHLGEAGFMALAAGLGADDHLHHPFGLDGDLGALLGRPGRRFDVVRQPQAQQPTLGRRRLAAGLETVPIGQPHGEIHIGLVGAAVVARVHGVAIGHGVGRDQVLAAQLDAVEAELLTGDIDQPFQGEIDLGPARGAIGLGRRGIGEDAQRTQTRRRNVVRPGDQGRPLGQGRKGDATRARVGDVGGPEA